MNDVDKIFTKEEQPSASNDTDTLIDVLALMKDHDRETKIRVLKCVVAFFGVEEDMES